MTSLLDAALQKAQEILGHLLANRFNVLYENVLWYASLRAMAEMADDVRHKIRNHCVRKEAAPLLAPEGTVPQGWREPVDGRGLHT